MARLYIVEPRWPGIGIFVFCLVVHLIVGLYGAIQGVWWPTAFGFLMVIVYAVAISAVIIRFAILYFILIGIKAIIVLLLVIALVLSIYVAAARPPDAYKIVYGLYPQNGNDLATYKTLSLAMMASVLILLLVNLVGLFASLYAYAYHHRYEASQIVTRA